MPRKRKTSSSSELCANCQEKVISSEGLQCQGPCGRWRHYQCLDMARCKVVAVKTGELVLRCPCPDCDPNPEATAWLSPCCQGLPCNIDNENNSKGEQDATSQGVTENPSPPCENVNCPAIQDNIHVVQIESPDSDTSKNPVVECLDGQAEQSMVTCPANKQDRIDSGKCSKECEDIQKAIRIATEAHRKLSNDADENYYQNEQEKIDSCSPRCRFGGYNVGPSRISGFCPTRTEPRMAMMISSSTEQLCRSMTELKRGVESLRQKQDAVEVCFQSMKQMCDAVEQLSVKIDLVCQKVTETFNEQHSSTSEPMKGGGMFRGSNSQGRCFCFNKCKGLR